MPCLTISLNISLTEEQQQLLSKNLSNVVATILSKPESYVMVIVQPEQVISMAGNHQPAAYLQLKSLGLNEQQTSLYAEQLYKVLEQHLNINQQRIYIEFHNGQRHLWAWNGSTFG